MPNWIINSVVITTEKNETAKEMFNKLINKNGNFTFNGIVPRPKELAEADTVMDDETAALEAAKYAVDTFGFENVKNEIFQIRDYLCKKSVHVSILAEKFGTISHYNEERAKKWYENQKNYKYFDWYEWSIDNWGCKWDACESSIDMAENDNHIHINFRTAWSTPFEFFKRLSAAYPEAQIYVEYADEMLGSNCGIYSMCLKHENDTDKNYFKNFDYEQGFKFSCDLWGYDQDEFNVDCEELLRQQKNELNLN